METTDDSFENFFNSESLSDRVLVITEVDKVFAATPATTRGKRRYATISDMSPELAPSSSKRLSTTPQNVDEETSNDHATSSTNLHQQEERIHITENEINTEHLNVMDIDENLNTNDVEIIEDTNQSNAPDDVGDDGDQLPPLIAENFQCPRIKTDDNFIEENDNAVSHAFNPEDEVTSPNIQPTTIVPKVEFEVRDNPSCSHHEDDPCRSASNECIPEVSISAVVTPTPRRNSSSPSITPTRLIDNNAVENQALKATKVYVHSVILAAKSQFFKCLFATSGMKETKEKEVKLEIAAGQTKSMLILLHCFYNKNFINAHTLQTVLDVCSLAMQYCYDGLIEKCLDIFRCRAENVTEVHDINQIAHMVSKIQCELQQHKEKCTRVMKTCGPFLVNSFYPIDELLEKAPEKFYQLHLNSMYLLLDPNVQERFNQEHGNLFIFAMQKWLKAHLPLILNDEQFKKDVVIFIEKLLSVVELRYITGAFLTNVMTYEHSPLALWDGYKEWYIRALQTYIFEYNSNKRTEGRVDQRFSIIKRRRFSKFVRQEKNADIFSLITPIILNGFEIGIYLRIREDRKIHVICKCKNILVNKTGFDQCDLQFKLKGTIKLNVDQNLWCEQFPAAHSHWVNDWFGFSYKQNTMCLQMYSICKLSPTIYDLAKKFGFCLAVQMQQIK